MILDSIKNLSVRNKIILTLFINSLVILLIIHFIIIPRAMLIEETGKDIINRRLFLEEQYVKAKNFRENNKEMELVDSDIQKLDDVFVSYDNDLKFIETLEKVAIDNKINQKISLGSVKNEEDSEFEKITLEISAEGSFLNIMNYLISLETLNYYVNVNFLDISSSNSQIVNNELLGNKPSASHKVICKIIADTYWK